MRETDLSVEEALARLMSILSPLPNEHVPLEDCLGRVLADDVIAAADLPAFASSSMDGFAVRSRDVTSATAERPARLTVVGEVVAGQWPSGKIGPGQAVRIATGAGLPEAADAVVPVEYTSEPWPILAHRDEASVEVRRPVAEGSFIRPAALDVRVGSVVLRAGHRLRPPDIGMLAAVGVARPSVRQKPRVALFATGDELREPGDDLKPGQLRDCSSYMLAAAVQREGCSPVSLGIVADDEGAVRAALESAAESGANLIVSSGGVSVGARDYVRMVLQSIGTLEFWRVNMRPGKPLAVGSYRGVPFLGLPGNPVSAFVCYEVFVRPALGRLEGESGIVRPTSVARLDEAVESDGRESYLRVKVWWQEGEYRARPSGDQDSSVLSSLVKANALLRLPAGVHRAARGEQVEVWWLWPG